MNVNSFLKELFEDRLGLDYLGLDYRFAELVQLIERKTLLGFSNCIGVKYLTYLDLGDHSKIVVLWLGWPSSPLLRHSRAW